MFGSKKPNSSVQPYNTFRLYTTHEFPVRYLAIPKCGCTFMKNVLWKIDFGEYYEDPKLIHKMDEKLLRCNAIGLSESDIRDEEYAFTIVRDPVDRFFSLYVDKIVGNGRKDFPPVAKLLSKNYGLNLDANSVLEHARNCWILLSWISSSLDDSAEIPKNPHWTPQAYRLGIISAFNLHLLTLDGLNSQLNILLGGLIPNLQEILDHAERNAPSLKLDKTKILSEELVGAIRSIYADDLRNYQFARTRWDQNVDGIRSSIPRASDLVSIGNSVTQTR